LSTGAAQTRVLGVRRGKKSENSNLASVEAMQWVFLYVFVMISVTANISHIMISVIANISHSTAKMLRSTIVHVSHSCSDWQWYSYIFK
jgi:hypothetical protein